MNTIRILSAPAEGGRVDTGPVQFGEADWPGLFIRGDDAGFYAMTLWVFINHLEAAGYGQHGIEKATAKRLAELLRSCLQGPAAEQLKALGKKLGPGEPPDTAEPFDRFISEEVWDTDPEANGRHIAMMIGTLAVQTAMRALCPDKLHSTKGPVGSLVWPEAAAARLELVTDAVAEVHRVLSTALARASRGPFKDAGKGNDQ